MMRLNKMVTFKGRGGPVLVVVMDGVGLAPAGKGNAVALARTPVLDGLVGSEMHVPLHAHGTHVGLSSDSDMGNSEVGHNTLGGGRIFAQGGKLVQEALAEGKLFEGENWREVEARGRKGGTVHFLGLVSDGNVHSHIDNLLALVGRCAEAGVRSVCVHALLDGRDVAPQSALGFVERLEGRLGEINAGGDFDYRIASGGGRMVITMDRYEADWGMVARGWEAHVHGRVDGEGREVVRGEGAVGAEIARQYAEGGEGFSDQMVQPFVVVDGEGKAVGAMRDGDAVVVFNFRGDRAIEICRAFEEEGFEGFKRGGEVPKVFFCGMVQYDGDLGVPKRYLVERGQIERTMVEYLCAEGVRSFAVSETQKFGHVTYFWNGNRSERFDADLETWVEIPSDSGAGAFEEKPEMKADEITEETIALLRSGEYGFGRVNFANGDMVGHSGNLAATVKAVEAVDRNVGRLLEVVEECGGVAIVTADHGNADEMLGEGGVVRTAHSLNAVPCAIFDAGGKGEYQLRGDLGDAGLANVAATALNLLGYQAPADYMPSLLHFPAEPHSRRVLHQGAVLELALETVQLPNEEMAALEVVRNRGGAVVVAQNGKGELALLRQYRHAAGGWIWEFPAGMLEAGESAQETAARELLEEAGYRADGWRSLGETVPIPGFCDERLYLFLATDLHEEKAAPEPHEFIEVHWKAAKEVQAMAQRGEINDAKSIVALFRMLGGG